MNSTSPTTVMAGIFAILFGLAAAYGVRQAMTPPPAPPVVEKAAPAPAPKPVPTRKIVIAKENIAPYATLTKENVYEAVIPEAEFAKLREDAKKDNNDIFGDMDATLNRVANAQIVAGNPIFEKALYEFGKVPTLEDKLKDGELAMSIPVSEMASVAGFLHPEARINISWIPSEAVHPDLPATMAVCIYKNVRVLATNADMHEYNPGTPREIKNITIAVSQKMANALNVLQQKGSFSVAMSSQNDDDTVTGTDEDRATIYNVLGLDAPEENWDSTASTDAWVGTAKRTNEFNSKEVLEATNATRVVMNNLKPLKKMPKKSMDPDTMVVE
ncbi:MAG: Flp pilus assembly protein CpaB [Planctomycetia bacterium]|nr:Flp pilus assembly protein CpaB [Planctomycetia bacterium]